MARPDPLFLWLVITSNTKRNTHFRKIGFVGVVNVAAQVNWAQGPAQPPCDPAVPALPGTVGAIHDGDAVNGESKWRLVGRQPVDMANGAQRREHCLWVVAGSITEMLHSKWNGFRNSLHRKARNLFNLKLQFFKVVGGEFAVQGKPAQGILLPRTSPPRKLEQFLVRHWCTYLPNHSVPVR